MAYCSNDSIISTPLRWLWDYFYHVLKRKIKTCRCLPGTSYTGTWPSGKLPFNCQKISKNLTFFPKNCQKCSFFSKKIANVHNILGNFLEKKVKFLAIFLTSNGNFREKGGVRDVLFSSASEHNHPKRNSSSPKATPFYSRVLVFLALKNNEKINHCFYVILWEVSASLGIFQGT